MSSVVSAAGLGILLATGIVATATSDHGQNVAVPAAATADAAWARSAGNTYSGTSQIDAITAAPQGSVWSAGDLTGQRKPLVERLTTKGWTRIAIPASMQDVQLDAIGASSDSNVWVGGTSTTANGYHVLRWNGSAWTSIPIEKGFFPGGFAPLNDKDVWAIGSSTQYAKHWDGTSWHDYTLGITTRAISASSASNVWAVGYNDARQPAVEHWNGSAWSSVPFPEIPGTVFSEIPSTFTDVRVVSDTDVWASGYAEVDGSTGSMTSRSLLAHWNGSQWSTEFGAEHTGFTHMSSDGAGGLWFSYGSKLLHRTSAGVWTTTNVQVPAGGSASVNGLALQPGTATVWAGGYTNNPDNTFSLAYWHD